MAFLVPLGADVSTQEVIQERASIIPSSLIVFSLKQVKLTWSPSVLMSKYSIPGPKWSISWRRVLDEIVQWYGVSCLLNFAWTGTATSNGRRCVDVSPFRNTIRTMKRLLIPSPSSTTTSHLSIRDCFSASRWASEPDRLRKSEMRAYSMELSQYPNAISCSKSCKGSHVWKFKALCSLKRSSISAGVLTRMYNVQ